MSDTSPGSRDVLVDRDAVRSWAEAHDAVPVRDRGGTGVPIDLSSADDPADRIDWTAFFDAFEHGRLALLVDGRSVEFVDRDRVAETDEDLPTARDARRSERRRARTCQQDEVVDPAATEREAEAADQENVDSHRDEEPFRS